MIEAADSARAGGCHCGQVRYAFDDEPTDASFCHCSICRRLTGSAFGSWCEVPSADFRWLDDEKVSSYPITERLVTRFCGNCGVTLAATHSNWPRYTYVLLGTLDDARGIAPAYHQFTGSKAPWFEIHDSLPRYESWPEGE